MQVRTAQWSLGVSGMTLLGIVAWARVPHGQALAAAVVLCMAAAGAAVSWYGARRRTEARTAAAVAAASEVPMPDLQGYVGEVDRQLEAARAEVAQTQTVFGDAILALFSSLKDISGQAHEQQALALGLTARGAMEGSSTGSKLTQCFDAFAKETDETLQFFVDATVQNSKLAMGLTDLIDNVRGQANAIQGALREVQAIAKQTDLLALNAAIEAARAGEAGRGFAVVADEVRMLSTRTSEFSRQIHVHIGTMHAASSSAERAIAEIASRDMNVALQSKRKVSQLMCDIGVVHGELQETASQLAQGTGKLAQEVGSAVAGMQLHSVITDLLSHVGTRIDALRAVTHSARPLACSAIDEGAARSGHSLLESAIRSARQATDRRDARLDAGKQRD